LAKEQVYIYDEDDSRRRFTNRQRFLIKTFGTLAVIIVLIIYLFLPPLAYLFLLPPFLFFVTRRDKEFNTEDRRLQYYLDMIPNKKVMLRNKFHKKINLPTDDLKRIEEEFPEITGNNNNSITAIEMENCLTCWYNKKIKRLAKAEISDIIKEKRSNTMLTTFNKEEKKVLIALIKYIAASDGQISDADIKESDKIASQKGFEDFSELFNEVEKEITSLDDLKSKLDLVKKKDHEYDIIRMAIEIAQADGEINHKEVEIIQYMADAWGIDLEEI